MNEIAVFSDENGSLGVIEFAKLPFKPLRFFWISEAGQAKIRANHAHRTCHQYLICQTGTVCAHLTFGPSNSSTHELVSGSSLHIPPLTWLKLTNFSQNAVLGVLASEPYCASEYITDRNELLRLWLQSDQVG